MTNTDPSQVSTVHDAVIDAKFSQALSDESASVCKSFRVEQPVFDCAQEILSRNSTTVSEFCRQALRRLVADYAGVSSDNL